MRMLLTVAAATVLGVAACSSPPPDAAPPGSVAAGTAQVTVNDTDTGTSDAVQCTFIGPMTTIATGDDDSGVTAVVSNAGELTTESLSIRNLGGFTGSYNAGLGRQAEVTQTGRTYEISGTADGFQTDQPSFRTEGTFAIKVAC